ncbi:MAG: hypothetical protein A3E83_03135 [Gammaproteobacteria bacterium RIFCSPHIGHO2_12_FULL_41_20]|nr:MAG: hypothetical protein A3E83_03135 [Gammaproteobacteria bacterium RIFCSPHIGHO2_12_FULL_41_20]
MTIAQKFIKKLQDATGNESLPVQFWGDYSSHDGIPTFQDVLDKYAEYCRDLSAPQKEAMSKIFWEQIKSIGTPIIEDNLTSDNTCNVYFLFPKDNISESEEKKDGTKKDLYLQGDFHGYGSTEGRQRLLELPDTGIMWHKDSMPRESIIVYKYIQVEPSHRGKKPVPELSPFFNDEEGLTPCSTNTAIFPEIPQSVCSDEYSTHTSPYPGFDSPERVLRVSADSKHAHISGRPINWPSLLSTETPTDTRHFVYHATLYSDQAGDLLRNEASVTKQYHDDLHYSDQTTSPYTNFTRAIQVFKPASGKIDDIIVVNDGIPYLITGILDHFEKMVNENKLSPNTAFVFIDALPGLKTTLSAEAAIAFDKDPSTNLPGMGVRLIDYKHGIDQYIDFIANKLFPQLIKEISIPDDPSHRVIIGSSLSGTASIYIGSRPDLFGAVIAQSPSPDNRAILSKIPRAMLTERNIHLSCGTFEHPDYAAANSNVEYAAELSRKLGIPLHTGAHGHQFVAWTEELERSLPDIIRQIDHGARVELFLKTQKSTAASLMEVGIAVASSATNTNKPDECLPQSNIAKTAKAEVEPDLSSQTEQTEPSHRSPTPFDSIINKGPKPK